MESSSILKQEQAGQIEKILANQDRSAFGILSKDDAGGYLYMTIVREIS